MKANMTARTLASIEPKRTDLHLDAVIESMKERDENAIWFAIEKYTAWMLDRDGPAISGQELLEELASLIEHRNLCALEDAETAGAISRAGGE